MAANWGEHDIRRYPRMSKQIILVYRPEAEGKEKTSFTRTKTLGLGGFMFESEQPLPVGTICRVKLVVGERNLGLRCRVVYTNETDQGSFEIGMEFTEISGDDREFLTALFMRDQYQVDPGQS